MKRLPFAVVILLFAALACNLPSGQNQGPDAAFTAAAQTVAAQLTGVAQTQAVSVPTSTPAPAATSTAIPALATATATVAPTNTQICDQALFIADVTIPDGTNEDPDATFTKTWRVKNTGTCSWTPAYTLAFASGNSMSGPSSQALVGNVNPGDTVNISVALKAPSSSGDYTGYWKLRNAAGVSFITMTVVIHVGSAGGAFAVTHVDFASTGGCGGFHTTATITVNGAGTITYHWVWSDGGTDTATHAPLTFSAAGSQSVSTDWNTTASGAKWIDIYIESPNHQQFGRANFSCP